MQYKGHGISIEMPKETDPILKYKDECGIST